jgi:hypothetical protein
LQYQYIMVNYDVAARKVRQSHATPFADSSAIRWQKFAQGGVTPANGVGKRLDMADGECVRTKGRERNAEV